MKALILLVCCVLTLNQVLGNSQFNITCEFTNETFFSERCSCCNVAGYLKIDMENSTLSIINSQNKKRTEAFSAKNKEILYLPKGISKALINLKVLEIFNSNLRKITAENLKEFDNLKYLILSHNKIKHLESDLFRHNTKLQTVNLNDNLISSIEPSFMKTRQDLTVLEFERNVCYSGSASDKAELNAIIETVKISCSLFIKVIKFNLTENKRKIEKLTNTNDNFNQIQTSHSQRLSSLQNQDERLNFSISKLQNEVTAVKEFSVNSNDFNKTIKELDRNCSFKIQSVENKYTQMLSKTIEIEKNVRTATTEIVNMSSKMKECESNLNMVKVKSDIISIDLTKIWIEIDRIDEYALLSTNSTFKNIEDVKASFSLILTNLEDKLKSLRNQINDKIRDKINDTEIRFNKKLETLLNHTNNMLKEKSRDIEAISKLFNPTNEKITNLTAKYLILVQRLSTFETSIEPLINTKISDIVESLLMKNLKVLENKHQIAINQMRDHINYLIISNVLLVILLILAVFYFIYNLKFKGNSNPYNHIQRNNSNCQQFNTILTHAPLYDQYNENVYNSTNHNDEPIYEAFESPYSGDDNEHYATADNVKYAQVEFNLYETTDDSVNLVHGDQDELYNDSTYDVTSRDSQNEKVDNSYNESTHETDDDTIYEVAGYSEAITADSVTSNAVSEENLYSELPAKIEENQNEFELYSIIKKG